MLFIKKVNPGKYFANCYIIGKQGSCGAVIDPGDDACDILKIIDNMKLDIKFIINTHGHFDHIGANSVIKEETGAQILIHKSEEDFLTNPDKNLSSFMGKFKVTGPEADRLLKDGEEIKIGAIKLNVLHTPGHSPGSISLYSKEKNVLFSGDTIFSMGVGRTDFPHSSQEQLSLSIKTSLLTLPAQTVVFPGHGEKTTIDDFRANIWERINL